MRTILSFCFILLSSPLLFSDNLTTSLEARIHTVASTTGDQKVAKVQPGSLVSLRAEVKNTGTRPSAPCSICIKFSYIEPFNDILEKRSFETETLSLPSISPGHVAVINFEKKHQWPSLNDFMRQNWNMRHYQAILKIDNPKTEIAIGYLPIFVSAYYYEGPATLTPQTVPGM